ncbi:hypothetical protein DFH07DRAFT_248927 [Mycena maculata]|uniref:Uncharacterized protein n=1 Tax=Mycena maculata TaxID=230809 RepID=A0AAD7MPX8_9AGAR|nr:hypothetical protein DFH07DRAFT_248927 [Mycena maculata]
MNRDAQDIRPLLAPRARISLVKLFVRGCTSTPQNLGGCRTESLPFTIGDGRQLLLALQSQKGPRACVLGGTGNICTFNNSALCDRGNLHARVRTQAVGGHIQARIGVQRTPRRRLVVIVHQSLVRDGRGGTLLESASAVPFLDHLQDFVGGRGKEVIAGIEKTIVWKVKAGSVQIRVRDDRRDEGRRFWEASQDIDKTMFLVRTRGSPGTPGF